MPQTFSALDAMPSPMQPQGELLRLLHSTKMPFGRYEGRVIGALPEGYLLWFAQKGFPRGRLGSLLALALEIKVNGLEQLVAKALARER